MVRDEPSYDISLRCEVEPQPRHTGVRNATANGRVTLASEIDALLNWAESAGARTYFLQSHRSDLLRPANRKLGTPTLDSSFDGLHVTRRPKDASRSDLPTVPTSGHR